MGVLTLTDGWLVFEGCRTDFALAPHDCSAVRPLTPVTIFGRAEFQIAGLSGDVRVVMAATESKDSVISLLSDWMQGHVAEETISVLPPLSSVAPPPVNRRLRIAGAACWVSLLVVLLLVIASAERAIGSMEHGVHIWVGFASAALGQIPVWCWLAFQQLAGSGRKRIGRRAAMARLARCRQEVLEAGSRSKTCGASLRTRDGVAGSEKPDLILLGGREAAD